MAGVEHKEGRRSRGTSKLLAGAAPATEGGIVDAARVAPPVVTDPPIAAADIVPAVPAGSEPDGAAVLLDPTLTAEPGAPMPIVTAAPVLAMEPSATDVVQADARADRIAEGLEPGATGDPVLDAVAGQPTIAIEGDTGASAAVAAAIGSAVDDGAMSDFAAAARDALGLPLQEGEYRGSLPTLGQIADALEHMVQHDPEGFDYLQTRYFGGGTSSAIDTSAATAYTVDVVAVSGPAQGRRRAGMSFGSAAKLFLASDLTADDIAALRADPALAVSITQMGWDEVARTGFDAFPR